jgi:division protein CdvB (Snf7/Vps24/ESCRT-III family)
MKMFAKEVEIMTECIRRLNEIGIYVGYVYDALFCKESEREIVQKIMNEVAVELGVNTIAD